MSFITINNIWQEYGDHVVLERLNLQVKEGEFCSMVGASGCGKSTFLRLLLGQEAPSRGVITLDGKPLRAEPDSSRGVVFQRYSVFPHSAWPLLRHSSCSRACCCSMSRLVRWIRGSEKTCTPCCCSCGAKPA